MRINLTILFKNLFVLSIVWLLVEGIFRKWIFPGLSTQLFALKYLLFGLTYLTYYLKVGKLGNLKYPFQLFIILLFLWCGFEFVYNPNNAPLLVVVMGPILYLFFIPLLNVTPHFFSSPDILDKFIKWLTFVSIPIFTLGTMQYFLPADSLINIHTENKLSDAEQGETLVGAFTRCMSIFSFVKVYTVYLTFVLNILLGKIVLLLIQKKNTTLYLSVFLFGLTNLIMTASRLPIGIIAVYFTIYVFYSFFFIETARNRVVIFLISLTVVSLLGYNFNESFKTSIDAFNDRIEMTEKLGQKKYGYTAKDRILERLNIFKFAEQAGAFGFGIGITYQGTGFYLDRIRPDIRYEEEGERIILELGVIGGVIMLLLRLSVLFFSFRLWRYTKDIKLHLMMLPFLLQIIPPTFFLTNFTFNYLDNFVYWFSFGMILAIGKMQQKENELATVS